MITPVDDMHVSDDVIDTLKVMNNPYASYQQDFPISKE
jgi:hypothetical protein